MAVAPATTVAAYPRLHAPVVVELTHMRVMNLRRGWPTAGDRGRQPRPGPPSASPAALDPARSGEHRKGKHLGGSVVRHHHIVRLVLRRGLENDAEPVAELYLRARKAAVPAIPMIVHTNEQTRSWIVRRVIPHTELWVAESDQGALVGMLALDNEWVDQLYVEPALTGHGIGGEPIALAKRERPCGTRLWSSSRTSGPSASTRDMASARKLALRATMRKARPTSYTSGIDEDADRCRERRAAPMPPVDAQSAAECPAASPGFPRRARDSAHGRLSRDARLISGPAGNGHDAAPGVTRKAATREAAQGSADAGPVGSPGTVRCNQIRPRESPLGRSATISPGL